MNKPRLMCVLAHPDDESLGVGGALAHYAAEGVETSLVVATRGERGWPSDPSDYPGPTALGKQREAELRAAAAILGVEDLAFLGYLDGDLDQADPAAATALIVAEMRRVRPHVVVTFGPDGAYGHPDHIAISQLTAAAVVAAADPSFDDGAGGQPHRAAKLYYRVWTPVEAAAFERAFGPTTIEVDGTPRGDVDWPDWAITTLVDASPWWRRVWDAVTCHRSQLPNLDALGRRLTEDDHRALWGHQTFYRVFSTVNGGRRVEQSLFEGLTPATAPPAPLAGVSPAASGNRRSPP